MTQEDVAQLAASLVLERVARRLYNAGAVDELRCLSRMSAQEIDVLVELERRSPSRPQASAGTVAA